MKTQNFSRFLSACALIFSALLGAPAHAYSSLYIFGDSLSDSGNNAAVIGADPLQTVSGNTYIPTFTYASGTYTNGAVWATTFAANLGLSALSLAVPGGTNYAFGGAQTSAPGPGPGGFPFSLTSQVNDYLGNHGNVADSNALYVLAGGGNNVRTTLAALYTPGLTLAQQQAIVINAALSFATDEGAMVDQLQAAGANNIIVWNAPNFGLSPYASALGAQGIGSFIANTMNLALSARLSGEVGVKTFDLYGLGTQVATNPSAYGLSNVTDACGAAINNCNPATSMFWDGIHPSAYGHQLIANAMLVVAVPEPDTYAMLLLGLGLIGGAVRKRKARQA